MATDIVISTSNDASFDPQIPPYIDVQNENDTDSTYDVLIRYDMQNTGKIIEYTKIKWAEIIYGQETNNSADKGEITFYSQSVVIPNLKMLSEYKFTLTIYGLSTSGSVVIKKSNDIVFNWTLPGPGSDGLKITDQPIDPVNLTIGKSYLSISNTKNNLQQNRYQLIHRTFDAIEAPKESPGTTYGDRYVPGATEGYYSYGTSLFFDPNIDNPNQGAILGFFVDSTGTKGYYITLENTFYSASKARNGVRVIKVGDGPSPIKIFDSQANQNTTLDGIYSGTNFKIDVKVKYYNGDVYMKIYINGFEIFAQDEYKYTAKTSKAAAKTNTPLPQTDGVALGCIAGTSTFDYVYGSNITKQQYEDANYTVNFYDGQFSNDLLSTAYGDLVYYSNSDTDEFTAKKTMVDEFGTVAREISRTDVKFDSRPSYPVYWSVGGNQAVTILNATETNFKGTSFLLNNTSTTVPVSDGAGTSYYMFGNTLADSGQLEYSTDEIADYAVKEPLIFQSKWLQNEADVKSLAQWIKGEVINRGQMVSLSVFGNPLIALGDIVTVNYPIQGFTGEERMIVTSVKHTYDGGLQTSVECRPINKTAKEASAGTYVPTKLANTTEVDTTVSSASPAVKKLGGDLTLWPEGISPVSHDSLTTTSTDGSGKTHILMWRKPDNATTTELWINAGGLGDWHKLGNWTEDFPTFDLNTINSNWTTDMSLNNDPYTNRYVSLFILATRQSSRSKETNADISFWYTSPTS